MGEGRDDGRVEPAHFHATWKRVVHDVRGPLAVVLGQTEMLLEEAYGPLTEKQRTVLLTIQRNGDLMTERMRDGSLRVRTALGLKD